MIVLMLACSPEVQGTEWVGPDGGVVEADGARLEIPPGMLAESTAITAAERRLLEQHGTAMRGAGKLE